MPGNLGRKFTVVTKYDAGPFKVTLQNASFTVAESVAIRGRVVDHAGRPVGGANVFLGGHQMLRIEDGKPERFDGPKGVTDVAGRFMLDGARGKATRIIVSAPRLHVWHAPVPAEEKELTIKLPEPATLVLRYDIEGDAAEGEFRLELKAWDMPDWKSVVGSCQRPTAPNKGQVVLKNVTPGVYDLFRSKMVVAGGMGFGRPLDRHTITLRPGESTVVEFIRKEGHPITGRITGLPKDSVPGVFIFVQGAQAVGERGDTVAFDGLACKPNGRFKTARIPPGTYTVKADAYKPTRGFRSGWPSPAFVGTAKVTVPRDRPPAEICIEMKKSG